VNDVDCFIGKTRRQARADAVGAARCSLRGRDGRPARDTGLAAQRTLFYDYHSSGGTFMT